MTDTADSVDLSESASGLNSTINDEDDQFYVDSSEAPQETTRKRRTKKKIRKKISTNDESDPRNLSNKTSAPRNTSLNVKTCTNTQGISTNENTNNTRSNSAEKKIILKKRISSAEQNASSNVQRKSSSDAVNNPGSNTNNIPNNSHNSNRHSAIIKASPNIGENNNNSNDDIRRKSQIVVNKNILKLNHNYQNSPQNNNQHITNNNQHITNNNQHINHNNNQHINHNNNQHINHNNNHNNNHNHNNNQNNENKKDVQKEIRIQNDTKTELLKEKNTQGLPLSHTESVKMPHRSNSQANMSSQERQISKSDQSSPSRKLVKKESNSYGDINLVAAINFESDKNEENMENPPQPKSSPGIPRKPSNDSLNKAATNFSPTPKPIKDNVLTDGNIPKLPNIRHGRQESIPVKYEPQDLLKAPISNRSIERSPPDNKVMMPTASSIASMQKANRLSSIKVKPAIQLSLSDSQSIVCYYANNIDPPPTGPLIAEFNNQSIDPHYLYTQEKVRINPIPLPPRAGKPPLPGKIAKGSAQSQFTESDNDSSEEDNAEFNNETLNRKNMPQKVFNNFADQYRQNPEETKQALNTFNVIPSNLHRMSSLATLSLNLIEDDAPHEESAFTGCLLGNGEDYESSPSGISPLLINDKHDHGVGISEKSRRRQIHINRNVSLYDVNENPINQTNPDFKDLMNQMNKEVAARNIQIGNEVSEYIDFNLTTLFRPDKSKITTFVQDGQTYVETISIDSFNDFKFGSDISGNDQDVLHIIAWHNLGLKPSFFASKIHSFASSIKNGNTINIDLVKSIIQYIIWWLCLFPNDFYGKDYCSSKTSDALNIILNLNIPETSKKSVVANKVCFLRACINGLKNKETSLDYFNMPVPTPTLTQNSNYATMRLMDLKLEPSVIAKHFTYIELEIFRKLQRSELVDLGWMKKEKEIYSPNFSNLLDRFNSTSVFIATSIMVDGAKNRAAKIAYWIKVMEEAKKIRNYMLLFEIDAALSCYPVNRLEATWKLVGKRQISTFNSLHSITNPTHKAIIKYKKDCSQYPEKTLPFIGPFLTDLIYLKEGNKDTRPLPDGTEGYNMKMQKAYADIIEFIFQDWGSKMKFQLDGLILEHCRQLSERKKSTDDLLIHSKIFEAARPGENI
ncbi:hypothetical protein TRFO_08776 [Tritrichomonas foetus]|uniref:Ras-GEF domain-containing protein n=1 Tax=Tritrichomonas foetus TaxID=1144522 RepID=A0A1J4JK49_9EUKA|nr:hypothetical protein TRFO_08776 [Tritrichomonas foetus]|eukprot:OHS98759.1 hypothetical protein TRFO_08776 [Tritrichomonas foetus]